MRKFHLEIGSSDFDTLNDLYADRSERRGVTVEAVPEYYNRLKKHRKNSYVNGVAVPALGSAHTVPFYHVPSEVIRSKGLPDWLRGCGSLYRDRKPLSDYGDDVVVRTELPAVSVNDLMDALKSLGLPYRHGRLKADDLKIDAEGEDYHLLRALLEYPVDFNRISFESKYMTGLEFEDIVRTLHRRGYDYRGRRGDSVTYARKSVLLIADEQWSTGSMAKDLQQLSTEWDVSIWDWRNYPERAEELFNEYDAVIGLTLFTPAGWTLLSRTTAVCCHPYEPRWLGVRGEPGNLKCAVLGGQSAETCAVLAGRYSDRRIMYTPVSARLDRFNRRMPGGELVTLGFCGKSGAAVNFYGEDMKRHGMFTELVRQTGLKGLTSEADYTYDTMQSFYDKIDMLVCPSATEGGPLGVFEAMACGVPVISTAVGLVREFPAMRFFATVEEARLIVNELRDNSKRAAYANAQYECLRDRFHMGLLLKHWENLFQAEAGRKRA